MTPTEIKALMILKGITQRSIAAQLSILPSTVSGAISGQRPSKRIKECVAKTLGENYEKLWGESA